MSDAFWIALFAGVPAILAGIVGLINWRKTGQLKDAVVQPLQTIHDTVNSNLAGVTRRAEIAEAKVKELEERIVRNHLAPDK